MATPKMLINFVLNRFKAKATDMMKIENIDYGKLKKMLFYLVNSDGSILSCTFEKYSGDAKLSIKEVDQLLTMVPVKFKKKDMEYAIVEMNFDEISIKIQFKFLNNEKLENLTF